MAQPAETVDQRVKPLEAGLAAWFLELAHMLRNAPSLQLLAEAIRTGSTSALDGVLHAVTVTTPELGRVIEQEARAALKLIIDQQPPDRRLELRFDIRDPRFEQIAEQVGGRLIREVPESVRKAVQEAVAAAYRDGAHPYDFAPTLRQMVGLTSRQTTAVANYSKMLTEKGSSQAFTEKATGRYADRLLVQRSKLIARTETLRAANLSRVAGFQYAADQGLVDRATAVLVWDTVDDPCPECEPLDGVTSPIDSIDFDGNGPPPLHPACRCVVQLQTG